jgi:hypothetical protein
MISMFVYWCKVVYWAAYRFVKRIKLKVWLATTPAGKEAAPSLQKDSMDSAKQAYRQRLKAKRETGRITIRQDGFYED